MTTADEFRNALRMAPHDLEHHSWVLFTVFGLVIVAATAIGGFVLLFLIDRRGED
jgi:hypothetical protein